MSALIGIYYYLRMIKIAYFDDAIKATKSSKSVHGELTLTLTMNAIALIVLGLFPSPLMDIATITSALIF